MNAMISSPMARIVSAATSGSRSARRLMRSIEACVSASRPSEKNR